MVMMYTPDVRNILVLAKELGMLDGNYAFYGLDAGLDSQMNLGLRPEVGFQCDLNVATKLLVKNI